MENRLSVLRAERSWSQQDLAERLEVSRQSVNAIETGKYDPSLPLAFRIAELFDAADRGSVRLAVAAQLESHLTFIFEQENCNARFRTDPCRLRGEHIELARRRRILRHPPGRRCRGTAAPHLGPVDRQRQPGRPDPRPVDVRAAVWDGIAPELARATG